MPPNASMVDLCPRPFRSFTICATGAMDKPALFKMAFELGAVSTSDFTDRTTHLIACAHGGAKYACALERKIPIMTPEWITEAHAVWLRGDDVDVAQGLAKYRLPIFSGVVLSLSGVEDVQRRTEINRLLTKHQGVYLKNLERPVRVTHLLCSGDTETDKMRYAEKFNKHKEANIHLVWEEWFWDCLEFGGRFDERKYQVSRPRPERKSLHENPISPPHAQDSAPGSDRDSAIPVDDPNQLRHSKSVVPAGSFAVINNFPIDGEEEEVAVINRPVPSVTLQLWQNLLKPRGFELDGGKLIKSPPKSQTTRSPPSTPTRPRARPNVVNHNESGVEHGKEKEKESVISSFRRANSFVPAPMKGSAVRQPFRRNTTCPLVPPRETEGSGLRDPVQPEGESSTTTLFAGYTFRLLGEARCPNVRFAIEKGGGVVMEDDAEGASFTIVRLISGSKLYHDEYDDNARTKYRTECWLEHSLFHERICTPEENVSFTPLRIAMPVPGAENIKLSLSGLDQSELCWIRRLVRAVGITLEPTFSRRSTHLLCPCGTGAKYDKALEWQIPVVSLAWLDHIAKTGVIPHAGEYLVSGFRADPPFEGDGFGHAQLLDSVPEIKRDKGKLKERETDCQMMDITNDGPVDEPMFVKNPILLQDAAPQYSEFDARQHRGRTLEPKSPARSGSFGRPRFLVHDSVPQGDAQGGENRPATSSPPALLPPSSSPPLAEAKPPHPASMSSVLAPLAPSLQHTPARQHSASMRDVDMVPADDQPPVPVPTQPHPPVPTQARIPSSSTPSPMKLLLPSSLPDAFGSSQPHLPDTDAITKALHESLTSLLGKRPGDDDEGTAEAAAKKGKRMRPIASREVSRDNVFRTPTRPRVIPPPPLGDLDPSILDDLGMARATGPQSTDDSLRVTYEDPGQAEEKRRLLRMLGGEVDAEVGKEVATRGGAARNVRVRGRTRYARRAKVAGY